MAEENTILVVEDNDFVRMQIVKFLNDEGYTVVEGTDGEDAVTRVKESKGSIVLAIVDVRMEPLDGFDFIRALRGMEVDIPVILVTGDQNPDLLSEASHWGVGAVLMKPVQRDRLLKIVARTLQIKQRS